MRSNSFGSTINGWEKVITASRIHEGLLPGAEPLRVALEWHLQEAMAVKARQKFHRAESTQATKELRQLQAGGLELAMRLGNLAKSALGPRDERLEQFGVAPLRPRGPKARKQQTSSSPEVRK